MSRDLIVYEEEQGGNAHQGRGEERRGDMEKGEERYIDDDEERREECHGLTRGNSKQITSK